MNITDIFSRLRRRLSYLVLSKPDRCVVSTALANNHLYATALEKRLRYNRLLRHMEGVYPTHDE